MCCASALNWMSTVCVSLHHHFWYVRYLCKLSKEWQWDNAFLVDFKTVNNVALSRSFQRWPHADMLSVSVKYSISVVVKWRSTWRRLSKVLRELSTAQFPPDNCSPFCSPVCKTSAYLWYIISSVKNDYAFTNLSNKRKCAPSFFTEKSLSEASSIYHKWVYPAHKKVFVLFYHF